MSGYQKAIEKIVGPEIDPGQVEAWMRLEHPTLDGLDAAQFRREARIGAKLVQSHPEESRTLAESYGLDVRRA